MKLAQGVRLIHAGMYICRDGGTPGLFFADLDLFLYTGNRVWYTVGSEDDMGGDPDEVLAGPLDATEIVKWWNAARETKGEKHGGT